MYPLRPQSRLSFMAFLLFLTAYVPSTFGRAPRSCGTQITSEQKEAAETHFKANQIIPADSISAIPIDIDVHFHVISKDKTTDGGNVPRQWIQSQVHLLSDSFKRAGLRFTLSNVTRTLEPQWFTDAGPGTGTQDTMKQALHVGGRKTLNIYSVGFESRQWQFAGIIGYTTFPWLFSDATSWDDGVVVLWSSLPGSSAVPYNLGATAIHEVGHWLGLYHTFQGGCDEPGDEVADTAPEAEAVFGCPIRSNTCKGQGADPIHNFMGFADDVCMSEFTPGQIRRIRSQSATYRRLNL